METRAASPSASPQSPFITSAMARRRCDGLNLSQAVMLAQSCSVPWVAAAAQEGEDQFLLGETYGFSFTDELGKPGLWSARYLMAAQPDGRSCLLALIPARDGSGWRLIRKDRAPHPTPLARD